MKKINWKIEKHETLEEFVSEDNRWHISKKVNGEKEIKLHLVNFDLLLSPIGSGKNYAECFENFLQNSEQHIQKIREAQQEIMDYVKALEKEATEQSK
jgi:hypothetical protein